MECKCKAVEKEKTESIVKKSKVETSAEIQNKIARTISLNLPGVRVMDNSLESNGAEMVGYFGLENTGILHKWIEISETVKGPIKTWIVGRTNEFSIKGKGPNTLWNSKTIFDSLLSDHPFIYLDQDLPLPMEEPFSDEKRGYQNWILTMHKILQDTFLFPPNRQIPPDEKVLHKHIAEDWNRVYNVLRFIRRYLHRGVKNKTATRLQNKTAIKSRFIMDADLKAEGVALMLSSRYLATWE